jgi:quinol monooxygenase YgiN
VRGRERGDGSGSITFGSVAETVGSIVVARTEDPSVMREVEPMSVYVIWESHFPPENAAAGLDVTAGIWRDMTVYAGYLGHELIRDVADAGHLVVVSRWTTQAAADEVRDRYASNPNAQRANSLVREPRRRFVGVGVGK